MRRTGLALAFALCAAGARAQWTPVAAGDEIFTPYVDLATLRRNGDMARMQGLYDFRRHDFTPEGHPFLSTTVLREYDCAGHRVRLLSFADHSGKMGEGNVVGASHLARRWETIVEGALDERFWKLACGRG